MSEGHPRVRLLTFALVLAFAASCTDTTRPAVRDVDDAPRLAKDAAAILVQFSAYDYGLAGALAGETTRTVAPPRYGTIARAAARRITAFNTTVVSVTLDRAGPIRDRVVPLADSLADLARDGASYADAGDAATFARVLSGVSEGWRHLGELASVLPPDPALASTIARGKSFVVTATAATRATLTVGPYASTADAQQALRAMGSPANAALSRAAPFVIRVGPYPDRAAADAASDSLKAQGLTVVVTDELSYAFKRGGPAPDVELWREPSRVQDTRAASRRLALSDDGGWVLTGGDDGYAALFEPSGALRALPRSPAGLSALAISDDARFFAIGGQTITFLGTSAGQQVGTPMRLANAATQLVFVPATRAFVAVSRGPTGESGGGAGIVGGRAPDGAPLGAPFPIVTPAAGAQVAVSAAGDVFIGTTSGGAYDIEMFRPGRDSDLRPVARVAGAGRGLAVDRAGAFAAAATDQGTYRIALADSRTVTRVAGPVVRELAFAPDATLYLLEPGALTAIGPDGGQRWTAPLLDGRRLVAGMRAVVLDGTDRLVAFAPADGAADELGAGGTIGDLVATPDGRVVGAIVDARRAVLFTLP